MNFDRQITRWSTQGADRVLVFGRWWDISKRPRYRPVLDERDNPRAKIVAGYRVDLRRRPVLWAEA